MRNQSSALTRRDLLGSSAAAAILSSLPEALSLVDVAFAAPVGAIPDGPFQRSLVIEAARKISQAPYVAPAADLPDVLRDLNYDQYRDIRFRPEASIWGNTDLKFRAQLFHRGFYFKDRVDISIVENGVSRRLIYTPEMFNYGPLVPKIPPSDTGFAGFRLHAPINRGDYFDEVVVFQGASYFRSLGRDQNYGLSARGLALKTADAEGEEFPIFRAFWIEAPIRGGSSIVVHALLDSPSVAGAYRFTIRPGLPTSVDVEATLFPRVELNRVGLAPGTTMFFFSGNGRERVDDYRPEVHDSDGLLMINGHGERLWRPLANPRVLQVSAFQDAGPRGFGLVQRSRDFGVYQDIEAAYERRPTMWIEPVGDWGKGAVQLVEIPSDSEINDNIVAYWAPRDPIPAGAEYTFAYHSFWGNDPAYAESGVIVCETRSGRANLEGPGPERLFVVDFAPANKAAAKNGPLPKATAVTSAGKVANVTVSPNPAIGGWRVSFHLDPAGAKLAELRAGLTFADGRPTETWVYRWTA